MAKTDTMMKMAQRPRLSTDVEPQTLLELNGLAAQASVEAGRRVTLREITLRGLRVVAMAHNNITLANRLEQEIKNEQTTKLADALNRLNTPAKPVEPVYPEGLRRLLGLDKDGK